MSFVGIAVNIWSARQFSPAEFFTAGEQGAVYEPMDLNTLFQDSAGTTPAYMPGQGSVDPPVGKMLDKSGRGNHAIQATAASRLVLSARVNLLADTTNFVTGWTTTDQTISAPGTLALDGSVAKMFTQGSAGTGVIRYDPTILANTSATQTIFAKRSNNQWLYVSVRDTVTPANRFAVWVDLTNGVKGTTLNLGTATGANATVTDAGSGWSKIVLAGAVNNAVTAVQLQMQQVDADSSNTRVTGAQTFLYGPDFRYTSDATTGRPAYQRVTDANTYDTNGFPLFLKADGVDDGMATAGNVDFTGISKATVWAGITKLSDAAVGIAIEHGTAGIDALAITFLDAPRNAATANYGTDIRDGTLVSTVTTTATFAAPITSVISTQIDSAGATIPAIP